MRYQHYEPNPIRTGAGDCVIRAICKAENKDWGTIYMDLSVEGMSLGELPNANMVWDSYLRRKGYKRYAIPNTCPDCYTVEQFAADYPVGTYILGTGTHAVTVRNGILYDSYDSSGKTPLYYYRKGD